MGRAQATLAKYSNIWISKENIFHHRQASENIETVSKSYIQWGAQHLRIKQYEHLKGFSVTIFALTQKTESDSAVDPLTKCQNCHLRSLLDYLLLQIDQVTLVTNQWLGLWRDAVGSDNARQNFAVVTTMEETDPGLSQLRAFSKLSIQIFIHASSHLRRDKHEFHFCSKLLISWPLCRWQRGFGAPHPPQTKRNTTTLPTTNGITEAAKWETKNYRFAKTKNCTIFRCASIS